MRLQSWSNFSHRSSCSHEVPETFLMTNAGLGKLTRSILLLVTFSTIYLDYWGYSRASYQDPTIFTQLLRGEGNAPQQYRIGVLQAADGLHRILHLNLRHAITLIDLVAALWAVSLLLSCLQSMAAYRHAPAQGKAIACTAYVILVQFYFSWLIWFQRPETLSSALSVALLLWLLTPRPGGERKLNTSLIAIGTLMVAFLQALVRADVVITLEAGVLLLCLLNRIRDTALPRWPQAGVSLIAILVAGGVQFYIMHVVYPHATYGNVQMVQLKLNLLNPIGFIPFCLFMVPYAYTLRDVLSRHPHLDHASLTIIPGSLLFLVLWSVFGRVDEVRIMLPYTLALAPLLATMVMQRITGSPQGVTEALV